MDERQQQQVNKQQDIQDMQRMDGQRHNDQRHKIMQMEQLLGQIVQQIWSYIHALHRQQLHHQ